MIGLLGTIDFGDILKNLLAPTGLVTLVGYGIFQYFRDKWANKKPKDAIEKAASIYGELNDCHYKIGASRILVLDAHNCGGTISYAQPMYGTIIYEVVSDIEPRLRRFDNVRLDNNYLDVLMALIKDGKVWYKTLELPENSYLRIANESDGVFKTCFFFIGNDKKSIKYGSISFKDDIEITAQIKDTISDLKHSLTNDFIQW